MILNNYLNVLFKKVENLFTKDAINLPKENLDKAINIQRVLKFAFVLILLIKISSFFVLKLVLDYYGQQDGLTSSQQVQSYHNSTLESLERHYLYDLYKNNKFGQFGTSEDTDLQKSLLDQAVTRMKNITMDDTFRRVMLFSEEFNTKTTAFLDNPVTQNPTTEYKMTMQELTSNFLLKIDNFNRGLNLIDIDFFV